MKPVFGRQLLTPSLHPWRGYEAHLPSLATYTTRRTSHRASSVLLPQISRRTPRVSQNLGTYRIFSTGLLSSTISPSWAARTAVNMSSSTPAIPTTMSGILIEQTGGVDVLQWREDLPVPELKEGEVLVKNEFIGVNYIDTYFRTGLYKAPLPLITGKEGAGIVAAVHPSVTRVSVGDKVGYLHDATYAAYTAVPEWKAHVLPAGITTQTAAASLLQGLTALSFVREAASVKAGQWTLVHAAAGGVGTNLCQMLRAVGARVIGTAGGEEKMQLARENGAEFVIDSRSGDLVGEVMRITNGHGVDVVFDGVGKATFDKDLEVVARKGTIVSFGNASGPVPPLDIMRLTLKNVKVLRPAIFNYIVTEEERTAYVTELFAMIAAGKVEIKVHKVYDLKDVAQAHADLEGRKTTGKLLLKM